MTTASGTPSVVGSSSHRELVARLAGAQKSNRGAAGYSRWVNRPLGRHLAATAYRLRATPNQVSLVSAACTMFGVAGIAVLRPAWPMAVGVVVLLVLGYALDSADGQLARLRGTGSAAGEWLDHVLDALKLGTFHLAIAVSWFRFYDDGRGARLLVPLAFSAITTVFFFAITLSDMLRRIARAGSGGPAVTTASVDPHEAAPVLRSLVVLPNDYGVLCLAMLLLPLQGAFTVAYSLLAAANALFLAAGCVRWFREMATLTR